MRKAAEFSEPRRGFLEIEAGEGIGIGTIRRDSESIEKGARHQMRRFPLHRADPEIDAGFAKIHRRQLRMGVGHVQDARIAEAFEVVNAWAVGAARDPRPTACKRGSACEAKKIPAADDHAMFPGFPVTVIARSEATKQSIVKCREKGWIASSQALLAMTASSLAYLEILPGFLFAGGLED